MVFLMKMKSKERNERKICKVNKFWVPTNSANIFFFLCTQSCFVVRIINAIFHSLPLFFPFLSIFIILLHPFHPTSGCWVRKKIILNFIYACKCCFFSFSKPEFSMSFLPLLLSPPSPLFYSINIYSFYNSIPLSSSPLFA